MVKSYKSAFPLIVHGKKLMLDIIDVLVSNGYRCDVRRLPDEDVYAVYFETLVNQRRLT